MAIFQSLDYWLSGIFNLNLISDHQAPFNKDLSIKYLILKAGLWNSIELKECAETIVSTWFFVRIWKDPPNIEGRMGKG